PSCLPGPPRIHGQALPVPNGMAGLGGITQPPIVPGETYVYAFDAKTSGTFLYRPHADARAQASMGLMGAIVVHPRKAEPHGVDRDFVLLLNAYDIVPTRAKPNIPAPLWTI